MFSLILPAYNESKRLKMCIDEAKKRLDEVGEPYEIIIAEDGSTDGTDKIAARLAKTDKKIRYLHHDKKLGRGKAVTLAAQKAKGDRIGFIDVDMATDMNCLKDLLNYSKKYSVVTGSRYIRGAKVERPGRRELVSRVYNWLIRWLVGVKLYDAQCGFKAFSREFVEKEMHKIKENTWAWDAAVLVHGIKNGYSFKEFPVVWRETRKASHSASFSRLFKDIKIHGRIVWKMFLKWRLGLSVEI